MTDDGDLPISFYRERHASKNRAGNFLAVTTLGTVLLLPPLQDFVSPGALRGAPLTFGELRRLLLSTAILNVIECRLTLNTVSSTPFRNSQVVPYDYPNATGAGKVWAVHIVRRPGTSGACTLDARPARSWFIIEQLVVVAARGPDCRRAVRAVLSHRHWYER